MEILGYIKAIDWKDPENLDTGRALLNDALEYMKRVEDHIYKGNEIRADSFMERADKQDAIRRLDRKRTEAHNKMLVSFESFKRLLNEKTDFDEKNYDLSNRTRIADFIAMIVFEMTGEEPSSRVEGNVRDELAEMIHNGRLSYDSIREIASNI